MQRNKQSIIFLLVCHALTVLLIGCEKEGLRNKSFSGAVTNLTTGEAAMGAKVQLIEEYLPPEPFSPVVRTVLQSTVTDKERFFQFDPIEKERRNRDYFVEIEDNGYYADHGWTNGDYSPVISSIQLENGNTTDINFEVVPFGSFDFIADINVSDSIQINGTMNNGLIEFTLLVIETNGRHYSRTPNIPMPSGDYTLVWEITENGETEVVEESFYLPFAEHIEMTFTYP